MSNKENYKKAFSVLKSSCDFTLEEKEMKKITRLNAHKNLLTAAAVLLVLVVGSGTAYAADIGGVRETVQLWLYGKQTDVTVNDDGSIEFVDNQGNVHEEGVFHGDGSPVTAEEVVEDFKDRVDVEKLDDGTVHVYYHDRDYDITDKIVEKEQKEKHGDAIEAKECHLHIVGVDPEVYVDIEFDENNEELGCSYGPTPNGCGEVKGSKVIWPNYDYIELN
ncbi:MAG: hypothetical protein J5504_09145 [Butyrivibrio sp.]|nr:hypothetical protein [Butyrivibrio sp.]